MTGLQSESNGSLAITGSEESPVLTFTFTLKSGSRIDNIEALRLALREKVEDHLQPLDDTSHAPLQHKPLAKDTLELSTDSDLSVDTPHEELSTSLPSLPDDVILHILRCLKDEDQIRSLTRVQQTCRRLYILARSLTWEKGEMTVSLLALNRIWTQQLFSVIDDEKTGKKGKWLRPASVSVDSGSDASESGASQSGVDALVNNETDDAVVDSAVAQHPTSDISIIHSRMTQGHDDQWHQTDGLARLRFQLSIITAVRVVAISPADTDDFVRLVDWREDDTLHQYKHHFGPDGDCLPKDAELPIGRSWNSISNLRFEGSPPFANVVHIHLDRSTLAQLAYTDRERNDGLTTGYILTPVHDVVRTTKHCHLSVDSPSINDHNWPFNIVQTCCNLIQDTSCKRFSVSCRHLSLLQFESLHGKRCRQLEEIALTIDGPRVKYAFWFFREILEMFTSHLEHIFARFAEGLSRKVSIRIVKWSPSGNLDSQKIPASLSDTMLAGLRGRMDEIITAGCVIFFPELVKRNRGFAKRYGTVDCLEREARKSIHVDLEELREASGVGRGNCGYLRRARGRRLARVWRSFSKGVRRIFNQLMFVIIGMQSYCLLLLRIEALSLAESNTMTKHLVSGGKQPFLSRSSSGSPNFSLTP